jgi:hypothetical protein
VNWWSRFFNWGDEWSWWNVFSLVKNHKWLSNKETFKFFTELLKK